MFFFQRLDEWTLRKTDGTVNGTVTIATLPNPWSDWDLEPGSINLNGELLFWIPNDDSGGRELWRTDGTPDGTREVSQFGGFECASFFTCSAHWMVPLEERGVALFSATDGAHGTELWRTDGTPEGTFLVKDIFSGKRPGILNAFGNPVSNELGMPLHAAVDNRLYLLARDSTSDYELWTSDARQKGPIEYETLTRDHAVRLLRQRRPGLRIPGRNIRGRRAPHITCGGYRFHVHARRRKRSRFSRCRAENLSLQRSQVSSCRREPSRYR